jgi:hypothetical protein
MSDDRKPVWPWIVALLMGLPVVYVLSIGPAWWIYEHSKSQIIGRCYYSFYAPIGWCWPAQMQPVLDWYLGLFISN